MHAVAEHLLSVSRKIQIAAPPSHVLAAWAGPLDIARWYVERRSGDPRLDRPFSWYEPRATSRAEGRATHAGAQAVHALRFLSDRRTPDDASELRVTIDAAGAGTLLTLEHGRFEAARQAELPGIASGWAAALALLKVYVEEGCGRPRQTVERVIEAPARTRDFAHAVASPQAIAAWARDHQASLRLNTPQDAVIAFRGLPGLVSLHLGARLVVSHTCWQEAPLPGGEVMVMQLAEQLAAFVAVCA
ncbi:MAG TPA: SRPBCC domain-containing protein [Burkholderiaceae bacterium]|jgi:uncharacterized protein YndB with AHSA1/START domain|nr:SRPBCC domain-containing protein [Burkholderiaceae bacterium]